MSGRVSGRYDESVRSVRLRYVRLGRAVQLGTVMECR